MDELSRALEKLERGDANTPPYCTRQTMPNPRLHACLRLLAMAVLALPAAQATSQQNSGNYVISYVVDGDSLWVHTADSNRSSTRRGRRLKLRLRGMDAPELCQHGGKQARAALRTLAPIGQRAHVRIHARDRYGRAIADVILIPENINLSRQMVIQGWAWNDDRGARHGPYAHEHRQAIQARRGLFAQDGAEHPADFRRRHGPCAADR